ncbi:hypothetical protein [Paenibacillus prosopidis]|uniref:Flagellar hook-length control protein FliK n=1 Tax=Paenibacillus prosopidis TaxID=630520 RepID=A0A368W4M0_9BACL|nr:hypothetical protein [Paenibacillus prosopidis]RCW50100.1 hypothetical protein DFP97_103118 [Paenibacillus prosopidis]
MNISHMMRSLLGEATSGESRGMELKAGQIIRGVILQVAENNEAIVQINGVQVRAKLELPLQMGQSALLQVQPQSNGALVVLKQVEPSAVGLPEDTFKEWAKQLALPEQKWAVEIVKDLRKEGVILNRDVAQSFQQAASTLPAGADTEQWMQASAALFKRGLPMTSAAIAGMQQVMFGRSAHELIDTLNQQLAAFAGGADAANALADRDLAEPKPLPQAAARVQALLAEGAALLRSAAASGEAHPAVTASSSPSAAPQAASAAPLPNQTARTETFTDAGLKQAAEAESSAAPGLPEPKAGHAAVNQPNWLGQMMKWLGVEHELQLTKALTEDAHPQMAAGLQPAAYPDNAASTVNNRNAATAASALVLQLEPDLPQAAVSAVQGAVDSFEEQQSTRITDLRQNEERAFAAAANQLSAAADDLVPDSPQPLQQQQESLKSALLSLVAAADTPPAIKETAQQLIQQITGQQLLLTPERNSSVFTHVTMFIPLNSQDGNQTASVHIQTRRGRKGELDAANCRLLFSLSMNTLGETMVDVNVTDKIVSLNLWNDHPAIAALADSSRSEIADSLQQAGYQLLSLRTTPLPKAGEQGAEAAAAAAKSRQPPDLSQFSSTRYKGVDYRI